MGLTRLAEFTGTSQIAKWNELELDSRGKARRKHNR
jgi:hypothetical protein